MNRKLKRNGTMLLIGLAFVVTTFSQVVALDQTGKKMLEMVQKDSQQTGIRYLNDVNGKVLRSFYKSFGEKRNANWARTEKGYVVCFAEKGIITNVYFMRNGSIDYRVNYYPGSMVPMEVRQAIKSCFSDYSITHVSEVHKNDCICFFLTIMDSASIKLIRYTAGDWKILQDVIRQ